MHPATASDDIDIYTIDFDWIKSTDNIRQLRKAKRILDADGPSHYPELYKELMDKLCKLDPKQRVLLEKNKPIDNEVKSQAEKELADWQNSMEKQEKELLKQKQKSKNKEIFEGDDENDEIEPEVEEIPEQQKRIIAENEKNKGNEALRAKDFDEAIQYYNKSLQFDPTFAISYCNRALAYLKLKKNYDQVISDCNNALKYDPSYLKAYFRRGKAYMEQKRYSKAVEDFQLIMEQEPQNSEVNAELKDARAQLQKQQSQLESKDKFKRVQIVEEEDSDEEEGEKEIEGKKEEENKEIEAKKQVDEKKEVEEKNKSQTEENNQIKQDQQQQQKQQLKVEEKKETKLIQVFFNQISYFVLGNQQQKRK